MVVMNIWGLDRVDLIIGKERRIICYDQSIITRIKIIEFSIFALVPFSTLVE